MGMGTDIAGITHITPVEVDTFISDNPGDPIVVALIGNGIYELRTS